MGSFEQHVIFTLDEQRYALPLHEVERIIPAVYVTPLPNAPTIVSGIITVQGNILPVLNLRCRLQCPARDLDPTQQFILVTTPRRRIALIVDTVVSVHTVPSQAITNREKILPGLKQVAGVFPQDDGIMFIYDLDTCLSLDEEQILDAALRAA
ncbi:MAG: chemotaxis protein CheW [Candidatus Binatia bacterium]